MAASRNSYLFRHGSLDAPLEEWKGVAWVHDRATNAECRMPNAEWRVQFVWPFRATYLVIGLDDDYGWEVVGYPSRKLAWVLSRKPSFEKTYHGIFQRMRQQGYDPTRLVKVPQQIL